MVKTMSEKSEYSNLNAYQQALDDFGITELRSHIRNYTDPDFDAALMNLEEQELESLAAILIQHLTDNLKGKLIASYLNALRHGDSDIRSHPTNLDIPPASIELPVNILNCGIPHYKEGDRVRWRTIDDSTDWGVVIGRFYAYAQHQCQWAVCYLIWLDQDSPSKTWTVADTAWEEDLEPSTDKNWGKSGDEESPLTSLETNQQHNHPILGANGSAHADRSSTTTLPLFSLYPLFQPSLHTPPGRYNSEGRNRINPRTLSQREQNLIELYSNCQLGMTPRMFHSKWSVRYEQLASICDRSISTVRRWFIRGRHYRRPASTDLRHLALMDFLLEHFEEIPSQLQNLLCLKIGAGG